MNRAKLTTIVFWILISNIVYGRSNLIPSGGKAAAMGDAFVSQYNVFSVYHNQAGLANCDYTASIFYENKYLVPEMSLRAAVITIPVANGVFAAQYNAFGPTNWSESNASLAYARYLNPKLSAGLQLNYFGTRFPEDNKTLSTVSFEFGLIYQLSEKTFIGAHVANPYTPAIKSSTYEETIPWRANIGGHTNFTTDFTLSYEIEATKDENPALEIGAEWEAINNFFIRGGYTTKSSLFSAGFGYATSHITIDMAFSYHQYLGFSPSASVIISVPKSKKSKE